MSLLIGRRLPRRCRRCRYWRRVVQRADGAAARAVDRQRFGAEGDAALELYRCAPLLTTVPAAVPPSAVAFWMFSTPEVTVFVPV